MASAQPYWDQYNDVNSMYFSFGADYTVKRHQQDLTSVGFERKMFGSSFPQSSSHHCQPLKPVDPAQLLLSSLHRSPEGDQVVPSFQKLSVYEQAPPYSPRRSSKPLPPLPDMGDLSPDEAADSEVEFFSSTSESQLLIPECASKPSAFQYRAQNRRSFRGCWQINYAYCDAVQENMIGQKCENEQVVLRDRDSLKQEKPQRRLRRSNSGPAASFKPTNLRNIHTQEKPEVPPRAPIPSCPQKSADCQGVEEPPEIPPRRPIYYMAPRTPSPKSLPIYVNGVMPPTQSFAPNPKYVSKTQGKAKYEGLPASHTPCILPIMEDGKKASATHYFLLPERPGYLDRFERFFKESDSESVQSGC
ncbi:ERBB receptor feedback inhibitor 1 [Tachysurus fulvidraco]|uniref:ERBB receptor feedback inhibitor 1 n=1 Tax=Tachysurus fulvidraco TaxID=1234273 RepID=UPI000F4F066F|nr:ERBB receptor feedback inhibitor 1 [Tachysurus fulvidraco]